MPTQLHFIPRLYYGFGTGGQELHGDKVHSTCPLHYQNDQHISVMTLECNLQNYPAPFPQLALNQVIFPPQHLHCLMETRRAGRHSSHMSMFVEMCSCEETMKNHKQIHRSWVYYSCIHKRQYYCNDEPAPFQPILSLSKKQLHM